MQNVYVETAWYSFRYIFVLSHFSQNEVASCEGEAIIVSTFQSVKYIHTYLYMEVNSQNFKQDNHNKNTTT